MNTRRTKLALVSSLLLTVGCTAVENEPFVPDPDSRLPGGDTTNTLLTGSNSFLPPANNITVENEMRFFTGNSYFNQGWVTAPATTTTRDGLGPLFNARACSSCHFKDGRGAPPTGDDPTNFAGLLLRVSVERDGLHAPHPVYGDQIQPSGIQNVLGEATQSVTYEEIDGEYPDGTTYTLQRPTYVLSDFNYGEPEVPLLISPRVAPQMIGLGLLEAISGERLEALADPDDFDGDGVSGRVIYMEDGSTPGRFGWKSEQPTLASQNAGAFLGDLGITSELKPEQNCTDTQSACKEAIEGGEFEIEPHLFERVTVYTSMVAVPQRRSWGNQDVELGEQLFEEVQCATCHTPRHVTGSHAIAELENQTIFPYTDLLVHDMGPELADERPPAYSGAARPTEWRTPPLWGIGLFPDVNKHQRLLHDGRARGVEEAILWHGGEAELAREQFKSLTKEERDALIAFINSL